MVVELRKLKSGEKKFEAKFIDDKTGKKLRTVRFGARGYEDYTMHKDPARKKMYITRHQKREDWTRAGKFSPGFWSRWLLWSEPSFADALKVTEKHVGQKIIYKR